MIKNNFDDVYYPSNLDEILYKNVDEKMITHIQRENKEFLNATSMFFMGKPITYLELFQNIELYAKSLKKYGISKGDCITLAMPNIPETIYYFYACNEIGVTAYLIDPRCSFDNMVKCINNSKSKLFICEMGTYYDKVAKNIDKLPLDNIVVVSPVHSLQQDNKIYSSKTLVASYLYSMKKFYEELKLSFNNNSRKIFQDDFIKMASKFTGNYSEEYDPDIPAIIVNTSGTTGGEVKGAIHSNRSYNIYTNQIPLITHELVRGYSYYGYVPYFSMYGSCVGMHTALTHGIVIDNIPKFNGKKSLEEIIKTKANILVGVPNLIDKLTDLYESKDLDASHVKVYVIGGDNVDPQRLNEENDILLKRGMSSKIIFGYGATETMPIATTSFDERSHVDGSTGIPYPGVSIKIVDPDTLEELPDYVEGEVYTHTPNMMEGYLNKEKESKELFKNFDGIEYFKTGDKGYKTENGILFLTGRYKRLMKRPDGHQTSPIPIENAIASYPCIKNCAVVGIKRNGKQNGVIPTAFIVLDKEIETVDKKLLVKNIAEHSLTNLSGERELALAYVFVNEIPMTINGKVDFVKISENTFEKMEYYILDDAVTKEYFGDVPNIEFIKYDKGISRTLNNN